MTAQDKVLERFPEAYVAPMSAGVYDIITPSDRPSPGYKNHRALGAGLTPAAAWLDAAKRILRRGWRSVPTSGEI